MTNRNVKWVSKPNKLQLQLNQPPNKELSDQKTPTPVEPIAFKNLLQGYDFDESQFLIDEFIEGFKIPYTDVRKFRMSKNLQGKDTILRGKIEAEVGRNRVAGRLIVYPFQIFKF